MVALEQSETEARNVVRTQQGFRFAVGEEPDDGALILGPHAIGGFLMYRPKRESIPSGSLLAPYVVDAFALTDRELKTGIGFLEPASAEM